MEAIPEIDNLEKGDGVGTNMERKLDLLDSTFLGLGAILGAGVFVVTGVAAEVAGPAMLVGFAIAGFVALCNALSVAQLAKVYPLSGGTYIYATKQLHPMAGFAAGWMFLVSKLAAAAVVALSFAHYVQAVVPAASVPITAVGLVVVLTLLNLLGIKKTSRVNLFVVLFTIGVLILFVLIGLPRSSSVHFVPFAPMGLKGILQSASLLFFAYTGYARIATLGEEVKNPAKTIPKAILLALGVSSILYLLVSYTLLGALPASQLATGSPLETAARRWGVPWLEFLLTVGAITAMVSVHLGQLLGISRMFYAISKHRDLPTGFSRLAGGRDVPQNALIFTAVLVIVLMLLGDLFSIVSIASFAILLYYSLANLSAITLAPEHRVYSKAVSWVGLIACIVLAFSLTRETILVGFLTLAAGLGYYVVWTYFRRS